LRLKTIRKSVVVALGAAITLCAADTNFSDGTFNDAAWTSSKVLDTTAGGATFSSAQVATGGNPGSFNRTDQASGNGTIYIAHLRNSFTYNPSTQGAIETLEYTYDSTEVSPPTPESAAGWVVLLVYQDDTYYATNIFDKVVPGKWFHFVRPGFTASSFRAVQDSAKHPDFSSTGGPIQFGFYTANLDTGGTTHIGVDNFSVTVKNGLPESRKILPQLAFGGGWYSAIYFTNTTASTVEIQIDFFDDSGNPLNVPSLGGASKTVSLPAQTTVIIEAPNLGDLQQGYASFPLPDGVTAYGVFRGSVPGLADQEAVVPLSSATATKTTLTWDDTQFTTAVAIVNPSSALGTIRVTVREASGGVIGSTTDLSILPKSKIAVALRDLFPGLQPVGGNRGYVEFTAIKGTVCVLGLRFRGVAFTSIPATEQ
jgi:hypothetical protein